MVPVGRPTFCSAETDVAFASGCMSGSALDSPALDGVSSGDGTVGAGVVPATGLSFPASDFLTTRRTFRFSVITRNSWRHHAEDGFAARAVDNRFLVSPVECVRDNTALALDIGHHRAVPRIDLVDLDSLVCWRKAPTI